MTGGPQPDNLPFPEVPDQKFAFAAIDPPWHFNTRGKVNPKDDRSPQKHYPTASLAHLKTLPVREMMRPNSTVGLWMTGPLLVLGVHNMLFDAWGVKPQSMGIVWIKLWPNTPMEQYARTPLLDQDVAVGGGYTTRQNAEFVVFGKIGSPSRARADIRQVIVSPRREHSRKPDEFFRRMEHYMIGPKVDMFGGAQRPGWTHWGWGHRQGEMPGYEPDPMAVPA